MHVVVDYLGELARSLRLHHAQRQNGQLLGNGGAQQRLQPEGRQVGAVEGLQAQPVGQNGAHQEAQHRPHRPGAWRLHQRMQRGGQKAQRCQAERRGHGGQRHRHMNAPAYRIHDAPRTGLAVVCSGGRRDPPASAGRPAARIEGLLVRAERGRFVRHRRLHPECDSSSKTMMTAAAGSVPNDPVGNMPGRADCVRSARFLPSCFLLAPKPARDGRLSRGLSYSEPVSEAATSLRNGVKR